MKEYQENNREVHFLSLGDFMPKIIPYSVLITRSEGMRSVRNEIEKAAGSDVNVLVSGETGTGKELVARIIHSHSTFKDGPFIRVCIPTTPVSLAEAFFFGHERGAFTGAVDKGVGYFEAANQGTIFLDEIGDFPSDLQPLLLEVVERKEIKRVGSPKPVELNLRIISASNKQVDVMAAKGVFRKDLFYRLSTVSIHLPSLRERTKDLPELSLHILDRLKFKYGVKKELRFAPEAIWAMEAYQWPGNVRELESVIARAFINCEGEIIREKDIVDSMNITKADKNGVTFKEKMKMVEKEFIEKALENNEYNISRTASELEIPRSTLQRKIKTFEIKLLVKP